MFALNANDGSLVWYFFSTYPHGTTFTDVNGNTFDAGDTFTTKTTPNDTPNNCYATAGATPWQHPAIDPAARDAVLRRSATRAAAPARRTAPAALGDNLFGSSVVALDLKTGAYKWHFQAVRHDIWDMDNALPPGSGRRRRSAA